MPSTTTSSAASPGPSTFEADLPVLVFDLDGTVLSINSFPVWVKYMIGGRFDLSLAYRTRLRLGAITVMLRRKAGLLGHAETKRRLQRLWSAAVARESQPIALPALVSQMAATVRPSMAAILAEVKHNNHPAILATAAAVEYAEALGRELGFTNIVCTPTAETADYAENLGEVKRDRVKACIAKLGLNGRRIVFFTDHRDDLPMIEISDAVLWFGPEDRLGMTRKETPESDISFCGGMSAQDVLALAIKAPGVRA